MDPYQVDAGFPFKGLAELTPFSAQEQGTSSDMVNVLPFDTNGRLRGRIRPGLQKYSSAQVSSSNAIQCVVSLSDTFTESSVGDGTSTTQGTTTTSTGFAIWTSAGVETEVVTAHTFLASVWGADGNVYVLENTTTALYLSKYSSSGVNSYTVQINTASGTPTYDDIWGFYVDSGIVYIHFEKVGSLGECILRCDASDGSNIDSSTGGAWIRHVESGAATQTQYWDGIATSGSNTSPTRNNGCIAVYKGVLCSAGNPGPSATDVTALYFIDARTGQIDFITSLGVVAAHVRRVFFDSEGFVYLAWNTASNNGVITQFEVSTGSLIWSYETGSIDTVQDAAWNDFRKAIVLVGSNPLTTSAKLALMDPDSKGVIEYSDVGSVNWDHVRVDSSGNYYLWDDATKRLDKWNDAFSQQWTKTVLGVTQKRSDTYSVLNSGHDEAGSTRYQELIAVANGNVQKMTTTTSTLVTGGSAALSTSAEVFAAKFGAYVFFADGTNEAYYDPDANEVKDWGDNQRFGGRLPQNFENITTWNQRIVIFGLTNDPNNYYFSKKGDPFDWRIKPNTANAAISGATGSTGRFPGKINAMVPYNNDLLIIGGDSSIHELSGDPALGGALNQVTSEVGMAPGRSWCRDLTGNVYFMGTNGGVYRLSLDSSPVKISSSVDEKLRQYDMTTAKVHLKNDEQRQGFWVFVYATSGALTENFFYSYRTEGWFPVKFGEGDYYSVCGDILDNDAADDRLILLGCQDGYIRKFDNSLPIDDTNPFDAYLTVGPFVARTIDSEIEICHLDVCVGKLTGATVEVYRGATPQTTIEDSNKAWDKDVTSGKITRTQPNIRGDALAIRYRRLNSESLELDMMRIGFKEGRAT